MRKKCLICEQNKLKKILSLGKQPFADTFINKSHLKKKEPVKNLELDICLNCGNVQTKYSTNTFQRYNLYNYSYTSSNSNFSRTHWTNYAKSLIKDLKINKESKVFEIGSNDGTFLQNFRNTNLDIIGFEPSSNVAEIANKAGAKTLNNFFNQDSINQINKFKNKTDVIYAANVICHVPDLNDLIKSIDKLLSKEGVFIFEEPYLGAMFEKTSYDQIYDEHIFMFSGSSIQKIFNLFDMELIDLIKQPTHGGSMRYVVSRKGYHKIK